MDSNKQIIFFGTCLQSDDPQMLGRIRVLPLNDVQSAVIQANPKFDPNSKSLSNGPWSDIDPFLFNPLLPYFVNQVPKKGEKVKLFYFNTETKYSLNRYYMMDQYSSPTSINFEDVNSAQLRSDAGYSNSAKSFPPIKNNDGQYVEENYKGVFAEPVDISINGRDTADLVIKKDEILLRAGKHNPFKSNEIPTANTNRGFLQISKFDSKFNFGTPQVKLRLVNQEIPVKYLFEYDIINPENEFSAFTGSLNIYTLPNQQDAYLTLTSIFDVDTEIDTTCSGKTSACKVKTIQFQALNFNELATFVNNTLKTFLTTPNNVLPLNIGNNEQFPFYFRPSKRVRDLTTRFTGSGNLLSATNMAQLTSLIKVSQTDPTPGYGLILDAKLSSDLPLNFKKEVYLPTTVERVENTAALLGANQLYLLSHESQIPGKDKIDLNNTIYGIDQTKVINEILPNTSSMVRGEELLELLGLIVSFCTTHVHPYPLMPPSAVSLGGTSIDSLLVKMQESYTKIINENIRMN
jgi:hypothetical protein